MTMSQVGWQGWMSRGARATRAVTLFVLAASAASSVASVLWHYESLADNGVADVLGAGDVNGDGADDLVVTELHTDYSGPEPVPGVRILLFLGAYDGTFATTPSWTGFVPDGQSRYGQIAAADVDADGFSDIIAVAQDFTEDWDCAAGLPDRPGWGNCSSLCVQGKLMIWRGGATMPLPAEPTWTYVGEPGPDQYGYLAVIAVGDTNDDGFPDVLVGDPRWGPASRCDDWNPRLDGRVLIFSGGQGFDLGAPSREIVGPLPTLCPAPDPATSQFDTPMFGSAIAAMGDADGMGGTDLAIGAPQANRPSALTCRDPDYESDAGAVYLYGRGAPGPTHSIWGVRPWEKFGAQVAGVIEGRGAGTDDLAVASIGFDYNIGQEFFEISTIHGRRSLSPETHRRHARRLGAIAVRSAHRGADEFGDYIVMEQDSLYCPDYDQPIPHVAAGGSGPPTGEPPFVPPFPPCSAGDCPYSFIADSVGDADNDLVEDFVFGYVRGWDSVAARVCWGAYVAGSNNGVVIPRQKETNCVDWIDNDADTLIDCLASPLGPDPDCEGRAGCPRFEGDCGDGADNDHDGAIDCADNDCIGHPPCGDQERFCDNGIDDDGDTLIDCADQPDCLGSFCAETICADGVDNDSDGLTDCSDPDCSSSEACGLDEEEPAENTPEPCPPENGGSAFTQDIAPPMDGPGIPDDCDSGVQPNDIHTDGRVPGGLILLHSGRELLRVTDLWARGPDEVSTVRIGRRHLTRANESASPFGPAWSFDYRQTIVQRPDGNLELHGAARRDVFARVGTTDVWRGTQGRYDQISSDSGGALILRTRGGTEATFLTEGAPGALVGVLGSIRSPRGGAIQFTFQSAAEEPDLLKRKMTGIVDAFIRTTHLNWGGDVQYPNAVSSIVDPDGRTVTYDYDTEGNLLTVSAPTLATVGDPADPVEPRVVMYQYRGSTGDPDLDASGKLRHAVTAAIYPNQLADPLNPGRPRLTWWFEESATGSRPQAWVTAHAIGDPATAPDDAAGGTYALEYGASSGVGVNDVRMETTVTDRSGTTTRLGLNRHGHLLSESVEARGLRPPSTTLGSSFKRSMEYNNDGDLVAITMPIGGTSERKHMSFASSRLSHGNEIGVRRVADLRGAAQASIERQIIYEPIFNKPFQVIDPRGVDGGNPAAYTTTYRLDYMENLAAAKAYFAPRLGLDEPALQQMFDDAGITSFAPPQNDFNSDGVTSQQFGNVVRIEYPRVTQPGVQDAQETFEYNFSGQIIREVDAEENVTTYDYYPRSEPAGGPSTPPGEGGFLRRVTRDAAAAPGRDSGDNPTPVLQETRFEYCEQLLGAFPANPRGVPTAIIDARGVKSLFKVNELNEVVRVVRAGAIASGAEPGLTAFNYDERRKYDREGNLIEVAIDDKGGLEGDAADIVTRFEYDVLNQLKRRVDDAGGLNVETTYKYDRSQNLIRRERAVGTTVASVETWTWDERDLPITYTRAVGTPDEATVTFDVDDNGNVVSITDAAGSDVTKMTYDGFDRLIKVVNRAGETTELELDAASNVTQQSLSGATDETHAVEQLLARQGTRFDERGRPYRTDRHLFHVPGRSVGALHDEDSQPGDGLLSSIVTRDRLGRIVAVTDEDATTSTFHWDGLSRLLEAQDPLGNILLQAHDALGNVRARQSIEVASEIGLLATPETFTSEFEFDSLGRLRETREPNGQTSRLTYDSRSNVVKEVDALGNEVEHRHDRLGRQLDTRAYLSSTGTGASAANFDATQGGGDGRITVASTWDAIGRLVSRIDDNGVATATTHDDHDRVRRVDHADGTFETSDFNADGELIAQRLQDGSVETWTNDAEGRPVAVDIATVLGGSAHREWGRDGLGRVVRSLDDNGLAEDVTIESFHDSLSRVIRERQMIGVMPPLNVDVEWSGLERLVRVDYPNGRIITRTHDKLDRIEEIREGVGGAAIAQYRYVGPSRLLREVLASGLVLDKSDPLSGSTILGSAAGYDSNGRDIRDRWRTSMGQERAGWTWAWNGPAGVGTNRRVSEARTQTLPGGGAGPTHVDSWALDSAYRQLSFLRNGSIPSVRALDGANKMRAFFDEGVARPIVVDGDPLEAGMEQYSSVDTVPRTYTENGALANDGQREYAFDETGRLIRVGDAATHMTLAEHVWSADGRRVLTRKGPETTRYLYLGWQVLEERSGADVVLRQFVDGAGIDDHVQMRDVVAGANYYYHSNTLGNVGLLTSASGQPLEAYEYSWLGQPSVLNLTNPGPVLDRSPRGNPYLFHGRAWDPETGLYDYRHRFYIADIGEFASIDPLGKWAHGMGTGYEAFGGDAWNNADPWGLATQGGLVTFHLGGGADFPRGRVFSSPELARALARTGRAAYWVRANTDCGTFSVFAAAADGTMNDIAHALTPHEWEMLAPLLDKLARASDAAGNGLANGTDGLLARGIPGATPEDAADFNEITQAQEAGWAKAYDTGQGLAQEGGELLIDEVVPAAGGTIARVPSKALRKLWEAETGRAWPKDPATGNNLDVSHEKALADGGTNEVQNIEPMLHDDHVRKHKEAGDFRRWGARGK